MRRIKPKEEPTVQKMDRESDWVLRRLVVCFVAVVAADERNI
jgi:hypothetical protein